MGEARRRGTREDRVYLAEQRIENERVAELLRANVLRRERAEQLRIRDAANHDREMLGLNPDPAREVKRERQRYRGGMSPALATAMVALGVTPYGNHE